MKKIKREIVILILGVLVALILNAAGDLADNGIPLMIFNLIERLACLITGVAIGCLYATYQYDEWLELENIGEKKADGMNLVKY